MSIKCIKPQRAQSLVEFALILPMLTLFMMVIFDLGRATYYFSALHNAAREGARSGVIYCPGPDCTSNVQITVDRLTAGLNTDTPVIGYADIDPTVDSDRDTITYNDKDVVQVTVTYTFKAATPFLAMLLGSNDNTFTLASHATMRIEG